MRVLAAITLVLTASAACFSPTEEDGVVPCGAGGVCPPGFTCGGDGFCYADAPPEDASVRDGAVSDAAPGDGPLVDAATTDAEISLTDAPPPDGGGPDALITECNDGIDNDCDGQVDFGNDPGCANATDPSELGNKQCDDGIDNDGDNGIDFHQVPGCGPTDPQCSGPNDPNE